jgi:penicillin-binding protein 1A
MAIAYSTFANGGFKVSSYYVDRIEDGAGKLLMQAEPAIACSQCGRVTEAPVEKTPTEKAAAGGAAARLAQLDGSAHDGKTLIPPKNLAPQIISPQIAYLMADMMSDVIKRGTGVRARALNRDDIAGKTGTTNDWHDAWFNGFNGDIVTSVWVGFDQDRSLGRGEEGGHVAVPIWTYFMREALAGVPRHPVPLPDGIVTAHIAPDSGLLASADDPKWIPEKFVEGTLPKAEIYEGPNKTNPNDSDKPLF